VLVLVATGIVSSLSAASVLILFFIAPAAYPC
jgi:hypothetical protein